MTPAGDAAGPRVILQELHLLFNTFDKDNRLVGERAWTVCFIHFNFSLLGNISETSAASSLITLVKYSIVCQWFLGWCRSMWSGTQLHWTRHVKGCLICHTLSYIWFLLIKCLISIFGFCLSSWVLHCCTGRGHEYVSYHGCWWKWKCWFQVN